MVKATAKGPVKKKKGKAGTSSADDRKALFVAAYLDNGGNATQAAITAGFSPKSADSQASRLLKDAKVKALVAEKTAAVLAKVELSVERTLREIARLAYSDPRRFYNADGSLKRIIDLDDDAAACVASVEVDEINAGETVIGNTVKMKQWDKNAALDKAMKFHGLYEKDREQSRPNVTVKMNMAGRV